MTAPTQNKEIQPVLTDKQRELADAVDRSKIVQAEMLEALKAKGMIMDEPAQTVETR